MIPMLVRAVDLQMYHGVFSAMPRGEHVQQEFTHSRASTTRPPREQTLPAYSNGRHLG